MKDIRVLRQRLHDLKASGRAIIEAAKADGRDFTDDDNQKLDAIKADVASVSAEIAAVEAALELERHFAPDAAADLPDAAARAGGVPAQPIPDSAARGGFDHLADFANAVRMAARPEGARHADRLTAMYHAAPSNFHQEQGTEEGYQVPPAFREEIYELVFAEDDLLGLVNPEPTSSNTVGMLRDETTPWGAAGVTANWRGEGTQMTPSQVATKSTQVSLHELYAFTLATEELLEDAPRLSDRLNRRAAEAIRYKASEAIIYGTGVGQPLGYFNSPALVTVGKETSQVADTIVAENVAKMFSRMLPGGLSRAIWIANSDVMPQLITMTLGNQPIWTPPSSGMVNAPGGMLLGRPIMFSEHAKTLGDKGDLQFIDPQGYYAASKNSGIAFASSMHLYFDYNMQAFRWTVRLGGQPFLSAAVSPANGANTKSHFVTLAARA